MSAKKNVACRSYLSSSVTMTTVLIITICILILIAYFFDITASRSKLPSVILLLVVGWLMQQLVNAVGFSLPDLSPALPPLGTVGLILIVLEGALELDFKKEKRALIVKSFIAALLPMLVLLVLIVILFENLGFSSTRINIINALPLCVISSAIAIPTVRNLSIAKREFIVYESSLSDIIGVLLFNFAIINAGVTLITVGSFIGQLALVLVLSFAFTILLSFLLSKIQHHIKFIPIIVLVVLIYALSKLWHLPGLVFILIFGLFLGNTRYLSHWPLVQKLGVNRLFDEVQRFSQITTEAAFLVRSLFFLLFGFLIKTEEVLNAGTLLTASCVVAFIFLIRGIFLWLLKVPLLPLFHIAPRGLITILLFLSISPAESIAVVNRSLIIQIIVITAVVMMIGMMFNKKETAVDLQNNQQ